MYNKKSIYNIYISGTIWGKKETLMIGERGLQFRGLGCKNVFPSLVGVSRIMIRIFSGSRTAKTAINGAKHVC